MKLSTKIILPIILISALLILLNGCTGVVPTDESPGFTPGTITGIIAAPCCTTSGGAVSNPPADWCCPTNTEISCQTDFFLQNNIKVILTYGEDEVDTTTTNEKGEYTFTDVPPAKNYVITVLCADDDILLVKDVAPEVVEGKIFDAEITDWVSTSLGLVVDYLVDNTTVLGPENIELDKVIKDKCQFIHFPAFLRLVIEVRRVGEECGDLYEDDAVQEALCRAAEEVGRIVIPDLDLGCVAGFAPIPPPVVYTLTIAVDPAIGGTTIPTVGAHSGYTYGTTANISATAKPGYKFLNWTGSTVANPNSASTTILMNGNKSVTANFTLLPTYTVTYDLNGGTSGTQTDTNDYFEGDPVTVKNQGSMLKTNYHFTGWNTETDGSGTDYAVGASFSMPAENVILYAQWLVDADYTVTYDANGGTGSQTDLLSPYFAGVTVTVLGQGTMARDKYNFTGWNTADDGTGDDYVENDTFTMPAADVILYAQWEKLDPLMSPIDVVPGQNQIRINLRDVNNNPVLDLDDMSDWEVALSVAGSDSTIESVQYGGPAVGPWDFQIRVTDIPQGTLLRNVTVTYNGYGYPIILHEAY